ncbi:FeS cluster assembly protein SufD [Candidatus Pantoea edessiphila]|uniref:FeS cluster assembly protein SufD n=1 Tax=Candidatus Pantoea edessiphila TaxID=2044610 RepID=A0A2P5SYV6_9GAMM|nr:Fe-S cluster assembly protein SufD [Candidatus Pantoea edessiphila]MBK4775388.1 Fe-S cluster assembly protein SufD [Pantoea sp. Edef]PPI87482.1 FeS cluster assembly protein SufD [Candidatus Pantoea edessiphila]
MAGLPKKNDGALHQWHNLFYINSIKRSEKAQKNWDQLITIGIPDVKHEDWKYTPLDKLLSQRFVLPTMKILDINEINKISINLNSFRLVFVNGYFMPTLSFYDNRIFEVKNTIAYKNINLPEPIKPEFFLHLNESLTEEITVIRLSKNKNTPIPLYLLHITDGYQNDLNTVNYRHHLILEDNTKAEIIEHFTTLNTHSHFTGSRLTFNIANNVNLKHTKLVFENTNSYHFSHNDIIVGYNSEITSNTFVTESNICRHNTSIKLDGKHSDVKVNSLSLPKNQETTDIRTYLEHNNSNCKSRQIHKTIVLEKSRIVFNGHIKVSSNALKTDGTMINNNLLLCNQAEVDSKPQLEIYADDVKCSHGVTMGCIDDEQIYYLRTRGIKEIDAQKMLVNAFALELIELLENDVVIKAILNRIDKLIFRENM